MRSSTGLSSRTAAALAYSGWWVTGVLFWLLERRDPVVRFHAAQAMVAFGADALLILGFGGLAVASLSFLPMMFTLFAAAAAAAWAAGVVMWGIVMWKTARGGGWRIPAAASWADRFAGPT
ncbi:MAG: hypothetical protein HY657_16315 [Acidobacteria bacterium]|nr:hypothetical protein [Acidobacteriota bacterium]